MTEVYPGSRSEELRGCYGLYVVTALALILANGVELQPPLPELGRRIADILEGEEEFVLGDGRIVKRYSGLFRLAETLKVAAAVSLLEGSRLIEMHIDAGENSEQYLRVISGEGEETLVRIIIRRPRLERLQEIGGRVIYLSRFLREALEVDPDMLNIKREELGGQRLSGCTVVTGWYINNMNGAGPLYLFKGPKSEIVKSAEELRGVCVYPCYPLADTLFEPEYSLIRIME